jgi:chaperonin GroEL
MAAGEHPMVLKNEMLDASNKIIEVLNRMAVRNLDFDMLKNIATISANGDTQTAELVTQVLTKLGPDGTVSIEKSKSIEPSVNFISGYELNYGFLSPSFVTDSVQSKTELENPLILLFDNKVKSDQ